MMFIKNVVEKPITIALLEALIYRLKQPPPRLEAMLKGLNQGFRAERELLYYLERARVFKEDVFLLHDLRLPANGSTFFSNRLPPSYPSVCFYTRGQKSATLLYL